MLTTNIQHHVIDKTLSPLTLLGGQLYTQNKDLEWIGPR